MIPRCECALRQAGYLRHLSARQRIVWCVWFRHNNPLGSAGLSDDGVGQPPIAADGDHPDLTLTNQVNSVLAVVEIVDAVLPDAEAAARAVVTDVPGEPIALTLYREDETVSVIALPPIRALALAAKLIEAALPRLKEGNAC